MRRTVGLVRYWNFVSGFVIIAAFIFTFSVCGIAADNQKEDISGQNAPDGKTADIAKIQLEKPQQNDGSQVKSGDQASVDELKAENSEDNQQVFIAKIKELQNQRRKISLEIYQMRVKLIKEEPDLQVLQRSIMDMHRRMAVELNRNEQMNKMLSEAKKIDSQIVELINVNQKNKPEQITEQENKNNKNQ